ncbi:uncharacterized protein LOC110465238 isoform X2 [Mizuhopecten yessoensis]|uniref:uncharacterized protein LOC110465238 isoform X2 n=1 Tax=Mizuhopecten yessoensis TaxID=6573 RepID=UPI000B45F0F4|nr:uncharacterized protein LOC110465238 isoform X2 [Mizuhopecten yessoensis]
MDAMTPVTVLSHFFQAENVDVAVVMVKTDLCMKNIEADKGCNTPYLTELKDDLQHSRFLEHEITSSDFNPKSLAENLLYSDHQIFIHSRFLKIGPRGMMTPH